jgi:tripeptidyl-peptidase-1
VRFYFFSPLSNRPSSSIKLTATTQVFGGIISLLNDYLLYQNRPTLGFLNPWLYGSGQAGLNDITSGSSSGCGSNGFPAVVGWDAVRCARLTFLLSTLVDSVLKATGLGTPNFVELQGVLPRRK